MRFSKPWNQAAPKLKDERDGISVVAPWAYKENYENIDKVREFWVAKLHDQDERYKETIHILQNIKVRLDSQTAAGSNRFVPIPRDLSDCKRYSAQWARPENYKY